MLNGDNHVHYHQLDSTLTLQLLSSAMTRPATISLGLLLLLIGYTAAGPESELQPRAVRSSACQDHSTLHDRLDVVEKMWVRRIASHCVPTPIEVARPRSRFFHQRVEDTVQKLEDELAVLLDAIDAPEWSPLLETAGKPVVDILDGQGLGEGVDS